MKAAVCGKSIANQKRSPPEGTCRSFAPQSRSARPSSPTAAAFSMPAISPTTQNAASRTPLHTRVITLRSLRCSARTHLLPPLILPRAASPHKRPYSNFPKKFCDIFRRISTFFDVEFCRMATKNVLSRRITTKSDELPRFNGLEIALNSCYYDYGRKSVIPAFIQRELETS